MIDTFLALSDQAAAKLQVNWPTDRQGVQYTPAAWLDAAGGALTVMPITVWTTRPVYGTPAFDPVTGAPNYTTPPTVSPLYWLWVASAQRIPRLEALAACKLVCDRDLAPDPSCILYRTMTLPQINAASVFPVMAGSAYPFGRQT